ncbi:MAG: TldD/PmbA family protein [Myxococcota bacterium]
MSTYRRDFLTLSGLATASMLLPGRAWAMPAGTRKPAPDSPPPTSAQAAAALAASPVAAHVDIAKKAVDAAVAAGASYADARLVLYRTQSLSVRDDHVDGVSQNDRYGIGVRVIAGGGWGFAAAGRVDEKTAASLAKTAVDAAKRNGAMLEALGKPAVAWVGAPVAKGTWVAPFETDPFAVPLPDKAELLIDAAKKVLGTGGVSHASAGVSIVGEDRIYVSSEGAQTHQIAYRLFPRLSGSAVNRRLGRFASRNLEVAPMQAGWEYVTGLDMLAHASQVGDDVLQKLHAAPVAPGKRNVILAPSNLWLTIHESIGHPTELDRAMGLEANYAGTSFIKPTDAGSLKIGAKGVNLVADRTQPGGLATVGWDDDGVQPGRWDIVRDGTFVGWQTTRDQAGWVGETASRGCSYGQGYDGVAFQRMPNISLQPGTEGYTTEDLINATEDGVLVSGRGSWSIDHQRYNFQFSGQMFWEIKRGRLTRPLRDVAYQANTVDFWNSCDMLGGEGTYRLGGTFGDGKGQPGQSNAVSHGCPPARFEANIVNTGAGK